ncbi:MAG: glycerol kinase GlpK [Pseudomonadota bacterium]
MGKLILAIDQGTTSSRAILFDEARSVVSVGQEEFAQHFPQSGWVEHDPEDIWKSTVNTIQEAIEKAGASPTDIAGAGITNQRETTVVWDRETGEAITNAIVWQDRRTADFCEKLKADGLEPLFTKKTGLLLDPYFSGTKLAWVLNTIPGARQRAQEGKLAFGTVDSFLIWRLTGGKVHATDATNASRTLLYNIIENTWDDALLDQLDIPTSLLPDVRDSNGDYGVIDQDLFGAEIPILGVAGDQQAAAIGQACFKPGMIKSTYGTGCFALYNTGCEPVFSSSRLLTTIAYRLNGETAYALEGSIFVAGASVQWLRDSLGLLDDAANSGAMAKAADPEQEVYLVPAFTGLGAPYWDADARGAMYGLTRNTGPNEFAKAALESVCYQTRDLIEAIRKDISADIELSRIRVDGGMVASDWTMQFLADILDVTVDRPKIYETTAIGAAWLAASQLGLWPDQEQMTNEWSAERTFSPEISEIERDRKYASWLDCVGRTRSR